MGDIEKSFFGLALLALGFCIMGIVYSTAHWTELINPSLERKFIHRSSLHLYHFSSPLVHLVQAGHRDLENQHSPTTKQQATLTGLQLPVCCLDGLLGIFRLQVSNLTTLPSKGLETLGQDRVRVVVAGVHPVGIHGAEVLDLELKEGLGQFFRVSELLSKGIWTGQY